MRTLFGYLLLFFFTNIYQFANAQFYNTGAAPYSVKWRAINTEKFKLIYPAEIDSSAQKFAATLDFMYPYTTHTLNHQPRKIDIIMQNQSVLSNGYVVWAPKRMEVVTLSPQRQYAHDWLEQLALHEYRHVTQVDKLNQGFTKGLSYIVGEMGTGAMMAFLPLWYLEGDAVVTETALSSSGRGRDPNFIQESMAAELQQSKRFTYDEFYLGSYRHYVPNHYNYGYHMVAWSRMQYGPEIWDKVLNNVGRRPFVMAPFYFKLKKETGLSKVGLYDSTYNYLAKEWRKENSTRYNNQHIIDTIETTYHSNFVSYRFPFETSEGTVLALRSSIDDISRLVEIENGEENVLYTTGNFQASKMTYSKNFVAWEEVHYDRRWEQRSYSLIRIYNRLTGKSELLAKKERHFAPAISPNSEKVCVISNDVISNSNIEVYTLSNKQIVKEIYPPFDAQLSFPTWLDNARIAVVALGKQGKSIQVVNTNTMEWEQVLAPGFENISYLHARENTVYFSYTYDGRVNLYAVNIVTKEIKRITAVLIGVNYPSLTADGKTLVFSEYTSEGFKPRRMDIDTANWTGLKHIKAYSYNLAENAAKQEKINIQDTVIAPKNFDSKPYSKGLHSFNVHSWVAPFYLPVDQLPDQELKLHPGFMLLSQNSLSTVTSSISYYYSDGYHHLRPTMSFRMLYPVITFDYLLGGPPSLMVVGELADTLPMLENYQELNTELSVPLNFSTSRYSLRLTPSIRHKYQRSYISTESFSDGNDFEFDGHYYFKGISKLDFRLSSSLSTKMAYKNLRPRWGAYFYISHLKPIKHQQLWSNNTVSVFTAQTPGFFRHHSTQLQFSTENGFGERLSLPRGYGSQFKLFDYNNAQKIAADYAFPVWYPNISLGPVAYFKRLHAKVYYDYFQYKNSEYNSYMSSTGIDLSVDTNFLRFFFTFVPTLRYSYLIDESKGSFGFVFSTSYGFSLGASSLH